MIIILTFSILKLYHLPYSAEYKRLPKQTRPPPPKFWDNVPVDSSSKIYMTTQFNDRINAVLTICLLHPMK